MTYLNFRVNEILTFGDKTMKFDFVLWYYFLIIVLGIWSGWRNGERFRLFPRFALELPIAGRVLQWI